MKTNIISVLVILVLVALGAFVYQNKASFDNSPTTAKDRLVPYQNTQYGLFFEYPSAYYLAERQAGTPERPQLSVVLVEDTQENRDLLAGKTTEPREGPISINIEAYPNPESLSASDWIKAETNWTLRTSDLSPVAVGTLDGQSYTWSGLYEGRTVVVTKDDKAYVFSVTWLTQNDQILKDYEMVLNSAKLGQE